MQKKKDTGKKESAFLAAVKEFGTGFLLGTLKSIYENFLETLQGYAYKTQKRIIDVFSIFFIFISGTVLLIIAAVFLLNEYLSLSFGWAFLVLGFIMLMVALLMKQRLERKK